MDSGDVKLVVEWFCAPILVASFLSCCAAGGVLALIVAYARRFGKSDRLAFRLLVGAFTVLLLADTANECSWTYRYTVQAQLDPTILFLLPPQFIVYSGITGVSILLVQGFFTWRIWIISGKSNYVFPGVLAVFELSAFGIALYMIYEATQRKLFREFGEVRGAPWAWLALGLLVDILVTAGTTYYLLLKPRKNGATVKDAVVHSPMTRVVLLTARTNAFSLFMQVITLWLMIWKITTFHYSIPGFQIVKIYIASVLVTLNSRRSTSDTSAEFSDAPGTSRFSHRSKAFGGARSTASRSQHQSVQVHIEEETHVDDSSIGGLAAGGAQPGVRPFAVKFESARTDSSGWTGGEKGDVELGRLDSVQLSEKY
ncbi:hypothetical protein JCM8208_006220 [Rhodotorula glutinis]